jgi:hypothetical protein
MFQVKKKRQAIVAEEEARKKAAVEIQESGKPFRSKGARYQLGRRMY